MKLQDYLALIDRFEASSLTRLEIEEEAYRIHMEKGGPSSAPDVAAQNASEPSSAASSESLLAAAPLNARRSFAGSSVESAGNGGGCGSKCGGSTSGGERNNSDRGAADGKRRGGADNAGADERPSIGGRSGSGRSASGGKDENEKPEPAESSWIEVKAPLVGVFYAAPSPEAPPFVQVGDRVEQGQVLCLVEAMKMMNQLKSPVSGIVRGIGGVDGELAEYGQVLFEVEPC